MSTTIQFNIERRETGHSTWQTFGVNLAVDTLSRQMELWHHDYPQHHFRVVKVTETKETLAKLTAKCRAESTQEDKR